MPDSYLQPDLSALPVNELAAAYQPRRIWAATLSITWNLVLATFLLASHGEWRLYFHLERFIDRHHLPHFAILGPVYIAILFLAYSFLNYPIDLWFGYLEERQFGLAKDGIRAWTRDWCRGVAQHAVLFCIGSSLLLMLQMALPVTWLLAFSLALLAIFILSSYFALSLLPQGLFEVESIDTANEKRIADLLHAKPGLLQDRWHGRLARAFSLQKARARRPCHLIPSADAGTPCILPPLLVFSAPNQRDFCGGLMGLGHRQVMLLSRSTLTAATDSLLRFVLLHDLGHKRYHHLLLSTLAGWAWVVLGLWISDDVIAKFSPASIGHSPYIAWLALTLSLWMALGEPVLAYLGRRLEYQADRFYLRHGGTLPEMRTALEELSHRNHARTEGLRRRHTVFHPLPSVWNRLHAARQFLMTVKTNVPTERIT